MTLSTNDTITAVGFVSYDPVSNNIMGAGATVEAAIATGQDDGVDGALRLGEGDPRYTVRRRYKRRHDAEPVAGRLMLSLLGGGVVWPMLRDPRKQTTSLDCDPREVHVDSRGQPGLYHARYGNADASYAVLSAIIGTRRACTALGARGASVTPAEFARFREGLAETDGSPEAWVADHQARLDAVFAEAVRLHHSRHA